MHYKHSLEDHTQSFTNFRYRCNYIINAAVLHVGPLVIDKLHFLTRRKEHSIGNGTNEKSSISVLVQSMVRLSEIGIGKEFTRICVHSVIMHIHVPLG